MRSAFFAAASHARRGSGALLLQSPSPVSEREREDGHAIWPSQPAMCSTQCSAVQCSRVTARIPATFLADVTIFVGPPHTRAIGRGTCRRTRLRLSCPRRPVPLPFCAAARCCRLCTLLCPLIIVSHGTGTLLAGSIRGRSPRYGPRLWWPSSVHGRKGLQRVRVRALPACNCSFPSSLFTCKNKDHVTHGADAFMHACVPSSLLCHIHRECGPAAA